MVKNALGIIKTGQLREVANPWRHGPSRYKIQNNTNEEKQHLGMQNTVNLGGFTVFVKHLTGWLV